jgi:hypothetical protein
MSYTNNMIQAPVEIADLQRCVPVTMRRTVNGVVETKISGDLGIIISGYVGQLVPDPDGKGSWTIISRVAINKWARYKPLRKNLLEYLTYQQRYNLSFGLNIPRLGLTENIFRSLAIKLMQYRNGTLQQDIPHWEYLLPRGAGHTEHYRLQDFCRNPSEMSQSTSFDNGDPTNTVDKGYEHDAQCPVDVYLLRRSGVEFLHEYEYEVNQLVTSVVTIYANQPNVIKGLHLFDLVAGLNSGEHSLIEPHYRICVEKWRNQTLVARYYSEPIWDNYSNYHIDVDVADAQTQTFNVELVIGIAKTRVIDGVISQSEGPDNFIVPFSDGDWTYKCYPFYNLLHVVSYAAIKAEILRDAQNVGDGMNGLLTWQVYAWMRDTNLWGDLWVKMHLSELTNGVAYQLVDGNHEPDAGKVGVRFGIQDRDKITMSGNVPTNLIIVTPSNASRQSATKVNITPSNKQADIYWTADVLDYNSESQYYINNGNPHNFQIYMQTKTGSDWSTWVDAEWLGIKRGTV